MDCGGFRLAGFFWEWAECAALRQAFAADSERFRSIGRP